MIIEGMRDKIRKEEYHFSDHAVRRMIKRAISRSEIEDVVMTGEIIEEYPDDKYLFVENVPAEVCTKCGEKIYSPEVTDELLKFAQDRLKPMKTIEVPVFDFAERI